MNVDAERFVSMDRNGASTVVLAAEFGMSTRSVARWRHRLGVSHGAAPVPASPAVRARALEMLEDGCPTTEVGRTLGYSDGTIRKWWPDGPRWTKAQSGEYAAMMRAERRRTA